MPEQLAFDLIAFERLNPPAPWSEAEVVQLFHLRVQQGLDWASVAREMGRTESGVRSKFKAVVFSRAKNSVPCANERISEKILEEQARRIVAWGERSLTATVFGDPPPQYSCLANRGV